MGRDLSLEYLIFALYFGRRLDILFQIRISCIVECPDM